MKIVSRFAVILAILVMMVFPVVSMATVERCDDPGQKNPITIRNLNTNKQSQGQTQGQLQGQLQGQAQGINAPITNTIQITNPDKILTAPEARPIEAPILQNGSVSNWNDYPEIPIKGATYLKKGEVVIKVLDIVRGWPLWRVRAEDVLPKIIANKITGVKVRYFVIKKSAVTGLGLSIAGAASGPVGEGLGTVSAPVGWTTSEKDDAHYITFVEIE
jgi:hypothetical protein